MATVINLQKNTYRPDIDGLRAFAVLSVMLYHLNARWLPGGFVGVDVFFVISGFVVTASLAASNAGSFFGFIGEFYARRLARILPALVLVLIVSALTATLFIPAAWLSGFSEKTALSAFFGLSNWTMQHNADTYFAPRAEFNPYTHTWSLGVEEQYYLIAPLLVFFWLRAIKRADTSGKNIAIAFLSLLTLLSLAACFWASKNQPTAAFYFIGCRLWELASGALLFLMSSYTFVSGGTHLEKYRGYWKTMSPLIGLLCVLVSFTFAASEKFPWPWALLPVLGTLIIIGGVNANAASCIRRSLANPILVWIGKRSYSLYLWHWTVYVIMRWTIGLHNPSRYAMALAFTFILSLASYHFIERPLRHNQWIENRPKFIRIATFVLLPVLGFYASSYIFEHRQKYSLSTVARSPIDWYAGHAMPYPNVSVRKCEVDIQHFPIAGGQAIRFQPRACVGAPSTQNISVLGDSHASAQASMFEQLSAELGVTVQVYSFAGCGYLDLNVSMQLWRPPGCIEFNQAIMNKTVTESKPGDIVYLPSLRMLRYGDQWASFNIPNMYDHMHNPEALKRRAEALEDAKKWLTPFAEKQLKVIFLAPTPIFKAPPFRCSDRFNHMNPICVGHNEQAREELERLRKPIIDSMISLNHTYPNVRIWDAFPVLCPDATCRTSKDGRPLFFDGDHLSGYGNLVLYPAFRGAMTQ